MLSIEEAKKNWTISFQKEVYKLVRKNDRKRTQLVERTRAYFWNISRRVNAISSLV